MVIFHTALDDYINELVFLKNYSPHTIRAYKSDILQWYQHSIDCKIDWNNFLKDDVISFFSILLDVHSITRRTQARKLITLRKFYEFSLERGYVKINIFSLLRTPKIPSRLPKVIKDGEMDILLESETRQNRLLQLRDMALFELLYSSGARVSELLYLNVVNILESDGQILGECKILGKGRKERIIFCTKIAKVTLGVYLNLRRKYFSKNINELLLEPLFINMRGTRLTSRGVGYILKQRKKHLGICSNSTVHSFRHSFATDMMNAGVDIRRIQEMLGHSSIKTTQNYTHIAKEKMIATFRNAHPHAKRPNLS